jgi:hypothetical protein
MSRFARENGMASVAITITVVCESVKVRVSCIRSPCCKMSRRAKGGTADHPGLPTSTPPTKTVLT